MTSATGSSPTTRHCALPRLLAEVFSGCGINKTFLSKKPVVLWARVKIPYQSCSEQIPSPVKTLQAYAKGGHKTRRVVIEAGKKSSTQQFEINLLNNLVKQLQFGVVQARLAYALIYLILVLDRYLNANVSPSYFSQQPPLEDTAFRIKLTRRNYIQTAEHYNWKKCTTSGHIWHHRCLSGLSQGKTFLTTREQAKGCPITQ
ncbi:LemA family protein [Microbulbifer sp. 2205BS26-8]|uniref:LemA family protein n=1 Tax=Microbulbifer sp. 2205BS26-8 TaxID=3064386 RepID=UPI00273E044B|nr:LemA family protein [Microbulbifer sp. 2205BS26-8]MDP5210647.1 LemA family protein [Microbulbifer sp. 2205BS26-8]